MKEIRCESIGEAWLKSCEHISKKGKAVLDGDKKLREVMNLIVSVKKPGQKDRIIEKYGDKKMIKWMLSNFLEQKNVPELKNAPSYGTRLFNYRGKNQIEWVIKKLREKPETKSATISMIMPEDENYIPCVSTLDFKIRNGKLGVFAMCRAIDFGKKVYANLIALNKIQNIVSEKTGIPSGELTIFVVSSHIYDEDYDKIKKILGRKK
ncbi:MAG: thymidylate synthase [Candidatus Methylomirabilota bacterium]